MAIRVLVCERSQRRHLPTIAINTKLRRLTLNSNACAIFVRETQKTPEFLQILVDDDEKNVFWVRPSEIDVIGSRRVDSPSPGTRSLHASSLVAEFNLNFEKTTRFEVEWDATIGAIKCKI